MKKLFLFTLVAVCLGGLVFYAAKWQKEKNMPVGGGEEKQNQAAQAGYQTFAHPGYGFSFEYPENWNATSMSQEEGELILVQSQSDANDSDDPNNPPTPLSEGGQNAGGIISEGGQDTGKETPLVKGGDLPDEALAKAGGGLKGFQIFISEFDEEGPITKDRILQDVSDLKIENEKIITVADSIEAIGFNGNDPTFGATYEVWFIKDYFLYQAVVPKTNQEILDKAMGSWKFQ